MIQIEIFNKKNKKNNKKRKGKVKAKEKEKEKKRKEDKSTRMSNQILKMKGNSKMKNIKNNMEKRYNICRLKVMIIKMIQIVSCRNSMMDNKKTRGMIKTKEKAGKMKVKKYNIRTLRNRFINSMNKKEAK